MRWHVSYDAHLFPPLQGPNRRDARAERVGPGDQSPCALNRYCWSYAATYVKAARVGEVAEVANLQQAVESDIMLAPPGLRQLERGQDAAVQVAEDEVR